MRDNIFKFGEQKQNQIQKSNKNDNLPYQKGLLSLTS